MNRTLPFLLFLIILLGIKVNAQEDTTFKTPGTYDQYVPVLFAFKNKPFSISRPDIHQDRNWLAYGIATINGIGFGWGSGNTKIKLENFTNSTRYSDNTGGNYSFVGKVIVEWPKNGIIVYLRGNTTYHTDGVVQRNDGKYIGPVGTPVFFTNLSPVSIDTPGYNVHAGVYIGEMEINSDTKSIESTESILKNVNGNIGIGTDAPKHKLDVNGTIHSKEVKVDMDGWADYVFKENYNLPTLQEVEKHIQEKGHLPNIPSEKEVIDNGLSVGENQKLLLQKIEELTLYIIEQNKKSSEQDSKIDQLTKEIQNLKNN